MWLLPFLRLCPHLNLFCRMHKREVFKNVRTRYYYTNTFLVYGPIYQQISRSLSIGPNNMYNFSVLPSMFSFMQSLTYGPAHGLCQPKTLSVFPTLTIGAIFYPIHGMPSWDFIYRAAHKLDKPASFALPLLHTLVASKQDLNEQLNVEKSRHTEAKKETKQLRSTTERSEKLLFAKSTLMRWYSTAVIDSEGQNWACRLLWE